MKFAKMSNNNFSGFGREVMQTLSRRCVGLLGKTSVSSQFLVTATTKAIHSMDEDDFLTSNGDAEDRQPKKKINGSKHPYVPKAVQPSVRKNDDGSWGPTGLYGGRVKETKLLNVLRNVVKPSRLKRLEEVLMARSKRVQCLFENLHDPANGAACLRSMEAFGVLNAHAVESYEPFRVSGGITMNADKVSRVAAAMGVVGAESQRL